MRRFFFPCDIPEILKIKLPSTRTNDFLAWNYENLGIFSVRSAYRLAMRINHDMGMIGSSLESDGERRMWKKLWNSFVPSKVKVFAWKLANNGLPTKANKYYRHLDTQKICDLCGYQEEGCFHAVINCPHALALRQLMKSYWCLSAECDITMTGPDWLLLIIDKYPTEILANFLMLIWRAWTVRNEVLQAGRRISIEGSTTFLKCYMDSLLQIRQQGQRSNPKQKGACLVRRRRSTGAGKPQ